MCTKYLKSILISSFRFILFTPLFIKKLNAKKSLHLRQSQNKKFKFGDEDGLAIVETVPLLSVFIILTTYAIGYWGAIHSGVLHSIAARSYALETFRNRAHLSQFRENQPLTENNPDYLDPKMGWGMRVHHITEVGSFRNNNNSEATAFPISFNNIKVDNSRDNNPSADYHNNLVLVGSGRTPSSVGDEKPDNVGENQIWLQIGHGICLNLACGDQ